jgi:hypothetical protein
MRIRQVSIHHVFTYSQAHLPTRQRVATSNLSQLHIDRSVHALYGGFFASTRRLNPIATVRGAIMPVTKKVAAKATKSVKPVAKAVAVKAVAKATKTKGSK